jgi:hypothetical protein
MVTLSWIRLTRVLRPGQGPDETRSLLKRKAVLGESSPLALPQVRASYKTCSLSRSAIQPLSGADMGLLRPAPEKSTTSGQRLPKAFLARYA